MKEKIKAFFQNEKVKSFNKKVFNKKTFIAAIIIVIVVVALRITFSLVFEVNGIVKKVDGSKITVTNFLNTQIVDVGSYPITASGIQVGDKIEITKNLSGEVYRVRDESKGHMNEEGNQNFNDNGEGKVRGNDQRNFKGRN